MAKLDKWKSVEWLRKISLDAKQRHDSENLDTSTYLILQVHLERASRIIRSYTEGAKR